MNMVSGIFSASLPFSFFDWYHEWESAGIFDFFLPALLIFAIIFGILSTTRVLGANRGINFLIAAAIALIAIRVPFVSDFFTTVFPNFSVALAIVVMIVILMGLFVNKGNLPDFLTTMMWGGLAIGVIVALVTLNQFDWFGSYWWQENWVSLLVILIIILAVVMPILNVPKTETEKKSWRDGFGMPWGPIRDAEKH